MANGFGFEASLYDCCAILGHIFSFFFHSGYNKEDNHWLSLLSFPLIQQFVPQRKGKYKLFIFRMGGGYPKAWSLVNRCCLDILQAPRSLPFPILVLFKNAILYLPAVSPCGLMGTGNCHLRKVAFSSMSISTPLPLFQGDFKEILSSQQQTVIFRPAGCSYTCTVLVQAKPTMERHHFKYIKRLER